MQLNIIVIILVFTINEGGTKECAYSKVEVTDDMFTSSSSLEGHSASEARLINERSGWIPATNFSGEEWIQVKFESAHLVTGITIRGGLKVITTISTYEQTNMTNTTEVVEYYTIIGLDSFRIEYGPNDNALLSSETFEIMNTNESEVQTIIPAVYTRLVRIVPFSNNTERFGIQFEITQCESDSTFSCPEDCYHVGQGMVDRTIATTQITSMNSYYYNDQDSARLNDGQGMLLHKRYSQVWVQVTFNEVRILSGIITKGYYYSTEYYVDTFAIELGMTSDSLKRIDQIFFGGHDLAYNIFEAQFSRYFRFIPLSSSRTDYYGIRLEILGCYIKQTCNCFVGNYRLQGLMDGRLRDNQLTASSMIYDGYGPSNARLHNVAVVEEQLYGCWVPDSITNEWIEIDLSSTRLITGVVTQGCHSDYVGQWVHSFNVSFGFRQKTLTMLNETFIGNTDETTTVINVWSPVYANVLRLIAINTNSIFFGLRFDIFGCELENECTFDDFRVRLGDSGLVEVQFDNGDWFRVCYQETSSEHGYALVCQYLGYSRVKTVSYLKDSSYNKDAYALECLSDDTSLLQCEFKQEQSYSKFTTLECENYYSFSKLETRIQSESEIIEFKFDDEDWGRICRNGLNNQQERDLICLHMGYVRSSDHHYYKDRDFDQKVFEVHCSDEAESLMQCAFTTEDYRCDDYKYATLQCEHATDSTTKKPDNIEAECPTYTGFSNVTTPSTNCYINENTFIVDPRHQFACAGYVTGWYVNDMSLYTNVQCCTVRQKVPELAVYTVIHCTDISYITGSKLVLEPDDWLPVEAGDKIGIKVKSGGKIYCADESAHDAAIVLYQENIDYAIESGQELSFSNAFIRVYSIAAITDTGCPSLSSWTYYNKWCFSPGDVNSRPDGADECRDRSAKLMPYPLKDYSFLDQIVGFNLQIWTDERSSGKCTTVELQHNVTIFRNVSCEQKLNVICAMRVKGNVIGQFVST
ncbi:uncharacterized protein [Antedon mediterranea]|uniref:uncharacterized protein n=1 Tax=Antedon mediterranea TaxID=105859 RepID=UPI003AF64301